MSVEKKWHRWVAIVVALLMLVTLAVPMNVSRVSADSGLSNPRIAEDGTVTWDCVSFGRYPQSSYSPEDEPQNPNETEVYTDTDGTEFVYVKSPANNMGNYYKIEPIKWRVLSVNGDEALLLSDKNLDGGIKYNETYKDVTWKSCTIRSWLNGYGSDQNQDKIDYTSDNFLNRAFTEDEQKGILKNTVKNTDNPQYKTLGGEDTKDKVFFPSIDEMLTAEYGFSMETDKDADSRKAKNTAYAASKNSYMSKAGATEWYWLRSPGETSSNASTINYNGRMYPNGGNVHVLSSACRFALYLNLNSAHWSHIGTVSDRLTPMVPMEVMPEGNVYKIYSPSELAWIAKVTNDGIQNFDGKVVRLMDDIDLDNYEWTPIGTKNNPFMGSFDGAGYEILNLSFNSLDKGGVFGYITSESSYFKNICLKNININRDADWGIPEHTIGTLIGECVSKGALEIKNVKVSNCTIDGCSLTTGGLIGRIQNQKNISITDIDITSSKISSKYGSNGFTGGKTGGIVGEIISTEGTVTTFQNVKFNGNISVGQGCGGGVCGIITSQGDINNSELFFENCHFKGDINATTTYGYNSAFAGGIVGNIANQKCKISQCSSVGNITAQGYHGSAGGIISIYDQKMESLTVEDSYARGNIRGLSTGGYTYAAGIVSWNNIESSIISNCYFVGTVDARIAAGGILSNSTESTTVSGCYCNENNQIVGKITNGNIQDSRVVESRDMKIQGTFHGWDFDNIWEINNAKNEGYPRHKNANFDEIEEPNNPEIDSGYEPPKPDYKPVEDVDMGSSGDSGSIQLFQNVGGSIGNSPIGQVFPGNYNLEFPLVKTKVEKESLEDGTYKYKLAIGVNENLAFGSEQAWENLKKEFADAKKTLNRTNTLSTLMNQWGASSGSFALTKSFSAKPSMDVAGYYEAICDENGSVISDQGGVLLTSKWNASAGKQFLLGPVPIYLDLGGSLKAVGQGGLEGMLSGSGVSLTGSITLTPGISVGAGLGVSGGATIGAKGSADVGIQLVPVSRGDLTAEAAITAKLVFVFDWSYTLAKATCSIWDSTQKAKMAAFFANEAKETELSLTERSYQKYTTQWKGQPAVAKNSRSLARTQSEDSGAAAWELQGYVLPDTIPLMKQVGDDIVLVFQSNDAQRNTQNSTKLMYSVYDGSVWSQPKALWDNGTLDTFADLERVGEDLYVVWQKCRESLTGSDVNALSEQAAKSSELCWAKYDPAKKTFGTPRYLTDNSLPDTMPVLAAEAEQPTVMWVQNNKTDLTGLTGTKTIFTSQLTGNQWSEPEKLGETDAYISQLVGISQDGTEKAAYLGSPASGGLPAVYLAENGTETQIAKSEETPISGLDCGDGAITYKKDGVLEQYQIADGTLSQWKAGQSQSVGSNARVYEQNGKKTLLWMTNGGDGCTFYASVKTEDGYSEPIEVYQNETLKGNYFTAQPAKNGGWEIVLNALETANEEKTSLYFIQTESQPKVELGDVVLNENEMEDANQPFAYSVTNDSEETITQFQLTVKDGTKVLVDKTISQRILPGETVCLEDTVDLSGVKETANLTIQVMAPGQTNLKDSSREQTVQMADLEVTVEKTVLDKSVRFIATMNNTGKVASDGDVILYGDAEGRRKLLTKHFDSIAPGETARVELEYPVSSMIFQGKESAYCMVQAVTDKEEFNAQNNTYYGATYLWELPEDNFQIAGFALSGAEGTYTYTGKAIRPAVTVKGLTAGKDYTVSYRNNVNAGTAQVVVTGIGRYHGTMVKEFTIRKASQTVTGKSYTKTYGNRAFSLGAKAKTKLSYTSSNTKVAMVNSAGKVTLKGPGKATITIKAVGTGNYNAASRNITITVKPKKTALKTAKSTKKRTLKVTWKRDTKATGYQVVIAQNKKFKKGKKTALIKKNKTTSRTFKKLKSRKNYYYKVRAYKQVGKTKIYGAYSKVKRIKVR